MRVPFDNEVFRRTPIVAILRGFGAEEVRQMSAAVVGGGLRNLEVTLNSPGFDELIEVSRRAVGEGVNIGAGTVCTLEDLERALQAGASYIVTPIVVEDVIRECVRREVPVFPGAMTPTEIHRAWSLGATLVKVFPATQLGAQFFRDLRGPLPQIELMPTGGVDESTLAEFHAAGARGFGVGGALFRGDWVASGDWMSIEACARRLVEVWQRCTAEESSTP